jgi:hypothetical protein
VALKKAGARAPSGRRRRLWLAWVLGSGLAAAVLALGIDFRPHADDTLVGKVRGLFAPASMSPGHVQIGLQCVACHGDRPMAGRDAMQEKCVACHARNDDNKVENAHPRAKFEDPDNADRLKRLDALHCVTCHSEHKPAAMNHVGLSLPKDFCMACHDELAKKTPSHAGMRFDSCTNTGCHSFHDNRATYRKLLKRNAGKAEPPDTRVLPMRDFGSRAAEFGVGENPHGKGKIGECRKCHEAEQASFGLGKHGVRQKAGLRPMRPAWSELAFTDAARDKELSCISCHKADKPDTKKAAVEACLDCHADEHSKAYRNTRHDELWREELAGRGAPGTGVSCATCHLPRYALDTPDGNRRIAVSHNSTGNLRPPIKQARVCLACHTLQFTHDSLADKNLMRRNFKGPPAKHVKSIEMEMARKPDKKTDP